MATIYIIKVVKAIRRVAAKAEDVMDSAEAVADAFRNVDGKLAAFKMLKNIIELVSKQKKK